MRGKLVYGVFGHSLIRIIPAHAGQTNLIQPDHKVIGDHPRTCGANNEILDYNRACLGSSPHMRGKPAYRLSYEALRRIIPAHAGQTPAVLA